MRIPSSLAAVAVVLATAAALAGCSAFGIAPGAPSRPLAADATRSAPLVAYAFGPAIVDGGPRPGATGTAEQGADGVWRYAVAEGDVAALVCDRFSRASWQLETEDLQAGFDCASPLRPGMILIPTCENHADMESHGGVPSRWPQTCD